MGIKFIDKDQNWETETTTYWFDVHGQAEFAIQDCNGQTTLLNWDYEDYGTDGPLYELLMKEREKHLND